MLSSSNGKIIQNYYHLILGIGTLVFAPIIFILFSYNMQSIAFIVLILYIILGVPSAVRGLPIIRSRKR